MGRLRKRYIAPVLIIVMGLGLLLNDVGVIPGIDWVWTLGLVVAGILTLAVGGIDRLTGVVGPFLLVSALCSVLRQLGALSVEREVPVLTIVLGALLLLVYALDLPTPKALRSDGKQP